VNKRATKGGKLVLPRVSDTVGDALHLMKQCTIGQQIEWLTPDFTDWFFNIPLRPDERIPSCLYFTGYDGITRKYICLVGGWE